MTAMGSYKRKTLSFRLKFTAKRPFGSYFPLFSSIFYGSPGPGIGDGRPAAWRPFSVTPGESPTYDISE